MGSEPRKERRRLVPIRSHLILQKPPLCEQIPSRAASASAAIAALGRRRLRCGVDCFVAALLAMTSAGPSPAALRRGLLRRYAPRNDDRWAVAAALRRGLLRRYAPSNDDRWAVAGRNFSVDCFVVIARRKTGVFRRPAVTCSFCPCGQELEVHYQWHPYFGSKVAVRRVEQRASGQFLKVLGPAGVVVSMAGGCSIQ